MIKDMTHRISKIHDKVKNDDNELQKLNELFKCVLASQKISKLPISNQWYVCSSFKDSRGKSCLKHES
jgi:hypothetical protein